MVGTQAANTRCVKTAPTNALTSRSSELFETSLCQGEDSIRQVWGPVGKDSFPTGAGFEITRDCPAT